MKNEDRRIENGGFVETWRATSPIKTTENNRTCVTSRIFSTIVIKKWNYSFGNYPGLYMLLFYY
ncbi:MAG: hypothetical protein LBR26_11665 [Prevotella sp.]|jgi:hypothetical protein|nr:hypothetical protein [Prevotella sp.]